MQEIDDIILDIAHPKKKSTSKVIVRKYYQNRGGFTMIKRLNLKDSTSIHPDFVDTLISLSGNAQKLFKEIKDNMDYRTNISTIQNKSISDKGNRSRAVKELRDANLCRKAKSGVVSNGYEGYVTFPSNTYMVNPEIILNPEQYSEAALLNWEKFI